MNTKTPMVVGILALGMQLAGCTEREVSFSSEILPIFQEHCIECHNGSGEGVSTSGFSVQDYGKVMRGTKFGKVIVPGSSISSSLFLAIAQKVAPEIQMPPHHGEAWAKGRGSPLSDEKVATIGLWIDQGAKNN